MASRDDKRERRERAAELRKERERQEKRRRNIITAAVVAAVLVVIAVAGVAVKSAVDNAAGDPVRTPKGLTEDNGVVLSATDLGGTANPEAVKVTIFEDFACPHCKSFETEAGAWIDEQVKAGTIEAEFRPIAFLTQFSSDALGASMCVFEESGSAAYRDFAEQVFANQPSEGGDVATSAFVEMAENAGAEGAKECVEGRPFRDWAEVQGPPTEAAFENPDADGNKLSGTPTIWVDGVTVNGPEVDGQPTTPGLADIQAAVEAAQAG
ncbi:thioredoxin domain-containing protein [Mumia zhuanghuii]|uniref:DsbA family protein n=2 Tax=Mumia TaxID=1546255 RepID=A0ABW1QS16_9ACTN|nr:MULTISPECIES: thioredoxin domain-containing protein [Mumia]KAA1418121.1 thioredoxin domain-containing protein [Mumia zhuanghuii]